MPPQISTLEGGVINQPFLSFPLDSNIPEQMKTALKAMGRLSFADQETLKAKDFHLEDMRRLVFKRKM